MGNRHPRQRNRELRGSNGKCESYHQIGASPNNSERSFASVSSHRSTPSSNSRPLSRVSTRRSSKTAWPVSQLESIFLPEFPKGSNSRKFEVLQEIARGAFGKVYKARENPTRQVYALKVLSKAKVLKEDAVIQVKEEVQIQRACGHFEFIVNCPLNWQSRTRLFIVSDFVGGGELHTLLNLYCVLPLVLVKLYVAQLSLTLDFLHNAGVIYRDLKPENILLDDDYNLQLTDFGLSKWLPYGSRTTTICGTFQYMAPEVVGMQPYGYAVDWWSLGVIACRMLTNKYPEAVVIAENELGHSDTKKPGSLPENVDLDVPSKDLLMRLLEIDPSKRLRSLRTLKTISFYKGYNFEAVKEKKVRPKDVLRKCFPKGPPNIAEEEPDFMEF